MDVHEGGEADVLGVGGGRIFEGRGSGLFFFYPFSISLSKVHSGESTKGVEIKSVRARSLRLAQRSTSPNELLASIFRNLKRANSGEKSHRLQQSESIGLQHRYLYIFFVAIFYNCVHHAVYQDLRNNSVEHAR